MDTTAVASDREAQFFADLATTQTSEAKDAMEAWVKALLAKHARLRRVTLHGRLTADERGITYSVSFFFNNPQAFTTSCFAPPNAGEDLVSVADISGIDDQADALYAIQDGFGSSDEARRFGLAIPADDDVTFDRAVAQ